jgi:stage V sporulation protein AD
LTDSGSGLLGAERTAATATSGERRTTLRFAHPVAVRGSASVAGPVEARGPLAGRFDRVIDDHLVGQRTWELAESRLQQMAVELACDQAGVRLADLDAVLGGDLLNQLGASSFAARELDRPFIGLYGACATLGAGLLLGAALCDAGHARRLAVVVSSHHDAAERQYRFPTEFGNQRPPSAQWTATGAAAFVLERAPAADDGGAADGGRPCIVAATPGRVVDWGVSSPYEMGAAEAPAAADTIAVHLAARGVGPERFDAVATGDLARIGRPLCEHLLRERGVALSLVDCGERLYDPDRQDVHAGGSGAACCGLVLAADLLPRLASGAWRRLLFVATGALLSVTSYQQGESIPCVAHAVEIVAAGERGAEA